MDATAVLSLQTANFRNLHEEGFELAHRPVCGDCHARLDYSLPFFAGQQSYTPHRNVKNAPIERGGKLYVHGINDLRSRGLTTPASWAEIATGLPEFGQCMSRRIVNEVFKGRATSEDYGAVYREYQTSQRYQEMMRVALTRRFDQAMSKDRWVPPKKDAAELVGNRCGVCHDEDHALDLTAESLTVQDVTAAVKEVASGTMPRGFPPLGQAERIEMIQALLQYIPVAKRASIEKAFDWRPHLSFRPSILSKILHARVGKVPRRPGQRFPYQHLGADKIPMTAEMAVFVVQEALLACSSAKREELENCLQEVTSALPIP